MSELLRVDNLSTSVFSDIGEVRAVDNVSIRVERGEAVALVGESGCGKSMTALSVMRLIRPPVRILGGTVALDGESLLEKGDREMCAIRGRKIAMTFQDPMSFLNPVRRVGDQIAEAIRLHQPVSSAQALRRAVEILERMRIPSPETVLNYYPHQLSGGMRQRVLIGIAVCCDPDLIIADEPTTALDVTIQAQVMDLMRDLRQQSGSALLLITHDLGLVAEYCDRVYVMYAGRIVEEAPVTQIFSAPRHPYTRALLRSTLSVDRRVESFVPIVGNPPNLAYPPSGCRFHPRCPDAFDRCGKEEPALMAPQPGEAFRCWLT